MAGAKRLVVFCRQGVGQPHQLGDSVVGDAVEGVLALPAHLHIAAVGQAAQVGGDPSLRQPGMGDAFGDGVLAVEQELQQPQPHRIAQGAEELQAKAYTATPRAMAA